MRHARRAVTCFGLAAPAGKRHQSRRRMSYEVAVMRAGKPRLGPFPAELQVQLIETISRLIRKKAWPGESELEIPVSRAASWQQLVMRLESLAGPHAMRRFGKSTRRLVSRIKRLFQGAEAP
jgi:hypothetical protein